MKKISTLFKKDPNDLSRVINEIDPDNAWVLNDFAVTATRKWEGTACAIIGGRFYKRYDVKKGRAVPEGAIPCQEADPITGHHPHWIEVTFDKPEDKYHVEAFNSNHGFLPDGTYELIGPKVQGNPEGMKEHILMPHGNVLYNITEITFERIQKFLNEVNIEGIVFHHPDGRMCKIRKSDFGLKR